MLEGQHQEQHARHHAIEDEQMAEAGLQSGNRRRIFVRQAGPIVGRQVELRRLAETGSKATKIGSRYAAARRKARRTATRSEACRNT